MTTNKTPFHPIFQVGDYVVKSSSLDTDIRFSGVILGVISPHQLPACLSQLYGQKRMPSIIEGFMDRDKDALKNFHYMVQTGPPLESIEKFKRCFMSMDMEVAELLRKFLLETPIESVMSLYHPIQVICLESDLLPAINEQEGY